MANAPQVRLLMARDFPPEQARLIDALNPFLTDVTTALGGSLNADNMQWASRTIGLTYPQTVQAPTLATGWATDTTAPVGYWREGQTVYLCGKATGGTYGSGAIFTLPVGYRPVQPGLFTVGQSSVYTAVGNVAISTAGAVVADTIVSVQSGASTYLRFDGISFPVATSAPVALGTPFPITVKVPFRPVSCFVVGCKDAVGDPADLPGLRWGVVLSAGISALSVRDLPGLAPGSKYTVQLAVLGF